MVVRSAVVLCTKPHSLRCYSQELESAGIRCKMTDKSQDRASLSVERLASSAQSYNDEVGDLRGPLELEVADAVSVCWVEEKGRTVQARGKFGLRTKSVHVHEKTFLEEAERKVLSGALSHWQKKAEGDVAAAALGVGIAEARLLNVSVSVLEESMQEPDALLTLLDRLLSSIAGIGAPALLSSPSAFSTLRSLSFLTAARYQSASGGQPNPQLLEVVLRYAGQVDWAWAMFQPAPSQIPELLPLLVKGPLPTTTPTTTADSSDHIKAQTRLLLQFPWESCSALGSEQITSGVLPHLLAMAGHLGQEGETDFGAGSTGAELALLIIKVLETLAASHTGLSGEAYGAVLLCALCLAQGSSVAKVTGALGLPGQDIAQADILNVAQLVWSSLAAEHPKPGLAAQVLQHANWEKAVPQLPQKLRLRLLLTLLAVYRGVSSVAPSTSGGTYGVWVWSLLNGPLGATLTQLPDETHNSQAAVADADSVTNEVHMLCMTEAPAAREDVSALWAWLRAHLALGLLEGWAAANKTQAAGYADALLEGMQFFSLPEHLISNMRSQAVIGILMRFFDVATTNGEQFFRSKLQSMAMVLVDTLQNSTSDVCSPISEALHTVVRKGVAAAEGVQPQQVSRPASPAKAGSPGHREHAPPKRGSTVSPGPEALTFAARWLALLSCAAARGPLPAPALGLMSDLVQLLYYHAPPAPDAPGGAREGGRAGSLAIQDCMDSIREALGVEGAQQLWVLLLKQHGANPVNLQWLPLLACWLSSTAEAARMERQGRHAQTAQKSPSSSPKKASGSPRQHGWQEGDGHIAASPAAVNGSQDDTADSSGGMWLDRNAEEALQLQEAAIRVGYGAAALPMWEEFLSRYFRYQKQLEPITPCAEISAHLAELSHLYEASCPVLSNIYMLLAPLSPESLPGGTPNFIAGNTEALRALMQLHPLKLGQPHKGPASKAVAPSTPDSPQTSSLRKAAVPPAAYEEVLKQQADIAAQLASSAELLRSWSHRREKRQAAATPPRHVPSSSAADNSDSDCEAPAAPSTDLEDLTTLKSPRMSQGSLDGDVPQVISQAQARLWEGLSVMAEHLDNLNAVIRELVVRRYRPPDIKRIEAGEYGDADDIPADEDPEFQLQYQKNREAALAAVIDFLTGDGLVGAGRLLYEVEVLLLGPPPGQGAAATPRAGKGAAGASVDEEQALSCKAQLLAVVGETILDESMPAAAVPFLLDLFRQTAYRLLPTNPALKVELVGRLMAAFASRGQAASREEEAVTLLSAGLGSQQLLAEGRLAEYNGCLACVLEACPKLPPSAVGHLLACFDLGGFAAALLHRGAPDADREQIQIGGQPPGGSGAEKPSPAAAHILGLAVDAMAAAGGEAAGVELLGGLLAAGGNAAYFCACLAVVLGARSAAARDAGLAFLTRQPFDTLPIDVGVEAMVQVTDDLNQAESARHEVPYTLLQKLLQAPCSVSALREVVATGTENTLKSSKDGRSVAWTATLSASATQQARSGCGGSTSGGGGGVDALKTSSAQVVLLAVHPHGDAVGRIELLIGACLQSILRRFGSGLDGMSMTEELTQLLALLLEPVGANAWLVDWLWALYKEALQPFLVLAGPASDGAATRRFRECWACLPWHRATFHCISPGGLAELGAYLLAPDRGALDLLHALPWDPILQRLAPAARPCAEPLPGDARQWATQLSLLALQALVLLPAEHLPGWLVGLAEPLPAGGSGEASKTDTAALRLPHVIAAADPHALQEVLCNCVEGLPFLLQPLVDAPSLLQGDPGPRLLKVSGLLTAAASIGSAAAMAAMAVSVIQGIMFTSVCRGFISGQSHSPDASPSDAHGTTEVIECWHLTAEEHSLLVTECLLPLCHLQATACMHAASVLLRPDARPPSSASASEAPPQTAAAGWRAPQLSQLVDRLGPHAAATSPSEHTPNKVSPAAPKVLRGSRLAVLGPVTDSTSGAQQPSGSGGGHGSASEEQYIAAALPAHALLSCLMARPRTVLTADPLPFANAETPLREPASEPAHRDAHDGSGRDGAGSDAASSTAGSEAKPDFLDKAISMAQRLKIQRRGRRAPTRQRLLQIEAADLQTIQSHIGALIEDSCQRRADELPLSIVRVAFTCAPLRQLPIGSTLLEDLVLSLLLSRPTAAPAAPLSDGSGVGRMSSYTEQTLASPEDPSEPGVNAAQAEAAAALLRTLEGLDDGAVVQVCADAADAGTPLVQSLVSERARRATVLDERLSWRHNVSQVLRAAAAAEARPGAPCHIAAVWLAALLWLEDARWRKLRSGGAPTDALEGLLDALSRRVLLLNLPPPAAHPDPVTPSAAGSDAFFEQQPHPSGSAHGPEGGKTLTRLTQNFKRMLPSGKGGGGGDAAESAQDGFAAPRKGLGRLKARFLGTKEAPTVDVPPSSFDYESSMGFPEMQGLRFGRLDPIPSGDSEAGSSRPQTPSRASEYSSPPGSPEEPPHRRGFGGLFVKTASNSMPTEAPEHRPSEAPARSRPARDYAARLAGDVKKALTGGKKAEAAAAEAAAKEAEAEAAAEAATDMVIRLGLAAFAVSAYIKTVLCPSLSSYTPRMSSASLAADLASSGGAFAAAVLGAQLQRQSASLGSLASISASGTPRLASHMSTPSASLDKLQREDLLMHELDQVLEARAELDSLEEIARCPLVAARADQYRGFFAAAPQLLQPAVGVRRFQRELAQLLFPDAPFLAAWACLLPAASSDGPRRAGPSL